MATQRKWHPYQDLLDVLDTVKIKSGFYLTSYLIMNKTKYTNLAS